MNQIDQAPWQAENLGVDVAVLRQNCFLFRKPVFSLQPSTDWMNPTHIIPDNLLYWESADLNVYHI